MPEAIHQNAPQRFQRAALLIAAVPLYCLYKPYVQQSEWVGTVAVVVIV